MRSSFPVAWGRLRASFRRRGAGLLLALAIEALIILALLNFIRVLTPPKESRPSFTEFTADKEAADEPKPETRAKAKARSSSSHETKPTPETPDVPPPPTPPPTAQADILWLPRTAYAATDIANAPVHAPEAPASDPGESAGHAGDSQVAERKGLHGETLYDVEWYRRPTHAELNTYVPPGAHENGWGEIYCRTAERYHVEDCQELGDAPHGSRFAGAVRQAAFQFLVRPPRKGGKSLVGTWVLIHIDYTFIEAK